MDACEICEQRAAGQTRLFEAAPEAVAVAATWTGHGGWTLHMKARRSGDCWHNGVVHRYEMLATDELLDVITADLAALFGVR